jgi:hypothetical protein
MFIVTAILFMLVFRSDATESGRATVNSFSTIQRKFSFENLNLNNVVRSVMQRNSSMLAAAATAAGISAGVSLLQRAASNIASR